jgi:hypothetical protein
MAGYHWLVSVLMKLINELRGRGRTNAVVKRQRSGER